MRRWGILLVMVLVIVLGCGRTPAGDQGEPGGRVAGAGDDERCDPSRARQCVGNDVVACEPDGKLGRRLQACHDGCDRGRCIATCADDGVQLIYVVDTAQQLRSFDPRKLPGDPFRTIGRLDCRGRRGPYSMSVDRRGVAWIIYDDGELFRVSIIDASCERVAYDPGATPFRRFGMGFVTDTPGGTTEKLFISADDGSHALGTIDTAHGLRPVRVGTLTAADERSPELTGTSEARLFGFYPVRGQPSFVQEIHRATGAAKGRRWLLGSAPLGEVSSWAFAQWAGVFYVFVTTYDDNAALDSTVRAVDRATGAYRVVLDHLPYQITGAGVSTCAPERDR
jgi:hypothetical protein